MFQNSFNYNLFFTHFSPENVTCLDGAFHAWFLPCQFSLKYDWLPLSNLKEIERFSHVKNKIVCLWWGTHHAFRKSYSKNTMCIWIQGEEFFLIEHWGKGEWGIARIQVLGCTKAEDAIAPAIGLGPRWFVQWGRPCGVRESVRVTNARETAWQKGSDSGFTSGHRPELLLSPGLQLGWSWSLSRYIG